METLWMYGMVKILLRQSYETLSAFRFHLDIFYCFDCYSIDSIDRILIWFLVASVHFLVFLTLSLFCRLISVFLLSTPFPFSSVLLPSSLLWLATSRIRLLQSRTRSHWKHLRMLFQKISKQVHLLGLVLVAPIVSPSSRFL